MIISIGILAHNESDQIAALIDDLSRQTIFEKPDLHIFLHVVANGCSDDTAKVARNAFNAERFQRPNITICITELATAGKANAWNQFIHVLADDTTMYAFLLDADIRLVGNNALTLTLEALALNPIASVAVGDPIKDVRLKPEKTLLDRLVLAFSRTTHDTTTALAGAMYCIKFSTARTIWLPIGIIGEDGFLRAMILTSNFTKNEDVDKLIFVQDARVTFETRKDIRDIFHHQVRLAMGTGLNVLLFAELRRLLRRGGDIESYVKTRNKEDASWLNSLVDREIRRGKYFVMNRSFLTRRPKHFLSLPFHLKVIKLPVYVLGTATDFLIFFVANIKMRSGATSGFW